VIENGWPLATPASISVIFGGDERFEIPEAFRPAAEICPESGVDRDRLC